jgi:S1-C subfamily serine protease
MVGALRLSSGVLVLARVQNAAAVDTSLHQGDVIHTFNGEVALTTENLKSLVQNVKAGDPIALLIERSGQFLYVSSSEVF